MKKTNEDMFQDFGKEVIVTSFTPSSIAEYFRTTPKYSTMWYEGWLSVSLKSASGQRLGFVRGYEKDRSNLILSFKMRDDLLAVSSKLVDKLYLGKIDFERVNGQEAATIKSRPAKHNFAIDLNVNKIHWQEDNGALDLQFESLGPALSWYIPSGRVEEELYYTAEVFRVTGTVLGEAVVGYGSLDQAWITPGVSWFASKGFLFFEEMWLIWANRYPDGSTDYGIVIGGPSNWNVAFYVDGGQVYTPKNNTIDVKWAEEGYPLRVDVAMDNNKVQLQWNSERRILEVKGFALWTNGQMLNLAKKEKPVEGYAWFEGVLFHKSEKAYAFVKKGANLLRHLPSFLQGRINTMMFAKGMTGKKSERNK